MDDFSNIRDVIDMWPTRAVLADEMSAILEVAGGRVTGEQVHKWAQKAAIPARFHQTLLEAARRRGFPVTADVIVRLHHLQRAAA
ncbi:MAG: hypothetical protein KDK24_06940 [Pseudooceanicola sp.]|nr:hypothetical protein [Pseudooceanicola sp.]